MHNFPFGVTQIKIVNKRSAFADATPEGGSDSVKRGFALFMETCVKCHSVNKVGGVMGPELNYPKSVVEYWKEGSLVGFIKNPSSYRNNSRMPSLSEVSDLDIGLIVAYLGYMSEHKVK